MHVKEHTASSELFDSMEGISPARDKHCCSARDRGAQHNPETQRIAPTGHPPTSPMIIQFSGSLEELVDICANLEAGAVVDLGGEAVRGSGSDELSGVSSSLASVDDGTSDTASGTSNPESSPSTGAEGAIEAPVPKRPKAVGPDLAMLMQQSPPVLLAEAPPMESAGLEPTYSFASIGKTVDKEASSGSIASTALFDDSLHEGPHADPVAASTGGSTGGSRILRKIASEAGMRTRHSFEHGSADTLSTGECVRRSCEFDSKGLDDRLTPDTCIPPVSCIVLSAIKGVTIRNGSLVLPDGHLLLLEGCNASFERCNISGTGVRSSSSRSLPLVYILHSEVIMRDCHVRSSDGHGIGVGKSASLVMQRCHVSDHQTCGLVVRGASSSIDLEDCFLESNGQDGIAVSDGALARASNCTLIRNGMLGLGVSAAAKAFLVACDIERNGSHGLAAHAASSLNATSCSISGCEAAILALDPATVVQSTACSLFKNEQGIHARDGAQVLAVDTSIERHKIGALVTSCHSFLDLSQSSIKHCRRAGVHVLGGARAKLRSCTISSNGENGCFVKHVHSTMIATKVAFTSNGTSGAQVSVGAVMNLDDCELSDNRIAGAQSTDAGTSMVLRGCSLAKNGTIGLFANKGSSVSATSCKLLQNGSSGCEVRDRCTRVLASACELSENGRVGVYVHSAGTMNLAACVVSKNRSLALLCGGREGTDIGGGLVTYCPQTKLDSGSKLRHGGRVYKSCEGLEDDGDAAVKIE